MTNFNERTNTLLSKKKYTSHTLFSKGLMLVVCERWVGDGNRPLHIDPSSSDHSSTSFASWLGCSTVGHWGPKPSVWSWFSLRWLQLQLTQAVCVLVIFLFDVRLLPLFLCLFTQVHLLIDGSVKGQYVTKWQFICRRLKNRRYW